MRIQFAFNVHSAKPVSNRFEFDSSVDWPLDLCETLPIQYFVYFSSKSSESLDSALLLFFRLHCVGMKDKRFSKLTGHRGKACFPRK